MSQRGMSLAALIEERTATAIEARRAVDAAWDALARADVKDAARAAARLADAATAYRFALSTLAELQADARDEEATGR